MPAIGLLAPARTLVAVRASGRAHSAEHHGCNVGAALAHEFTGGAMFSARHAVGDDGGSQRFNRPEQGNRNRIGKDGLDLGEVEGRKSGGGKRLRYAAEPRADCLNVEVQSGCQSRRARDGNQQTRPVRPEASEARDDDNGQDL
jgi:hypothetical protein